MTEPRLGGDVYNIDYYVSKAKDLESMGADSICLKDMAGLLAPYDAYEIIKALKATVKPPSAPCPMRTRTSTSSMATTAATSRPW